jgi:hypothetical protein
VSQKENNQNSIKPNKSGFAGAKIQSSGGNYQANWHNGSSKIAFGTYSSPECCHAIYIFLCAKYNPGFTARLIQDALVADHFAAGTLPHYLKSITDTKGNTAWQNILSKGY